MSTHHEQDTPPPRRWRRGSPKIAGFAVAAVAGSLLLAGGGAAQASTPAPYSQGFETDTSGWLDFGGTIARQPSGYSPGSGYAAGVPSAGGGYHARLTVDSGCTQDCSGPYTRFGGYTDTFPAGGYTTQLSIYLDTVWATTHADRRFDWSVSSSNNSGGFLRDFVFNVGTTATGFVVNGSTNAGRSGANPYIAASRVNVTTSGWYTFVHRFYNNGGVLAVDLHLVNSSGTTVGSWTRSDPSDVMSVVGGNHYGWFANQEVPDLAIDNTVLVPVYPGTGNYTCSGLVSYTTVNGDVNVPAGASCTLDHVTVTHNVNVGDSASLDVQASNIGNDIQEKHSASLIVRLGSTVASNVKVDGTNSVPSGYAFNFICNSTIGHDLVIQNSASTAPWVIGWIDPSACAKSVAIGNNANITGNKASINISDNSPPNGPNGNDGGIGHDLNVNKNAADITANNNLVEHNAVFQDNALQIV